MIDDNEAIVNNQSLYDKAWNMMINGIIEEAIIFCNLKLLIYDVPQMYYVRAKCYERKRMWKCAIDDFETAIMRTKLLLKSIDISNSNYKLAIKDIANYYYCRGIAYYNTKDYNKTIEDVTISIEYIRDDYRPYELRADSYMMIGDYVSAKKDCDAVVIINKLKGYLLYARYYDETDDYKIALSYYDKYIKENDNDSNAYYRRGLLKDTIENYNEVLRDYVKCIVINDHYHAAHHTIACACEENGVFDRNIIISHYLKALLYCNDYETRLRYYNSIISFENLFSTLLKETDITVPSMSTTGIAESPVPEQSQKTDSGNERETDDENEKQ